MKTSDEFTHPRLTQEIEEIDFAEDVEPDDDFQTGFVEEKPPKPDMTEEPGMSSSSSEEADYAEGAMVSDDIMIDDPCYYDPNRYECRQQGSVQNYEPYSKGDVHTMVWTSLLQVAYPITIFIVREAKVWEDLKGKDVENSDWTRDHYTDEIKAWE